MMKVGDFSQTLMPTYETKINEGINYILSMKETTWKT
jgi:hypothetical protein